MNTTYPSNSTQPVPSVFKFCYNAWNKLQMATKYRTVGKSTTHSTFSTTETKGQKSIISRSLSFPTFETTYAGGKKKKVRNPRSIFFQEILKQSLGDL